MYVNVYDSFRYSIMSLILNLFLIYAPEMTILGLITLIVEKKDLRVYVRIRDVTLLIFKKLGAKDFKIL